MHTNRSSFRETVGKMYHLICNPKGPSKTNNKFLKTSNKSSKTNNKFSKDGNKSSKTSNKSSKDGNKSSKTSNKKHQQSRNYLEKCTSLETTAETFAHMVDIHYGSIMNEEAIIMDDFHMEEVYQKLYDYVNRAMQPSFDEIDAMLLVCRVLIEYKMKDRIQEFILNCPNKFLITYSNNSERTPAVLHALEQLGLQNIRTYLISYVHETKLATWNERRNTHQRGNTLLECTI